MRTREMLVNGENAPKKERCSTDLCPEGVGVWGGREKQQGIVEYVLPMQPDTLFAVLQPDALFAV